MPTGLVEHLLIFVVVVVVVVVVAVVICQVVKSVLSVDDHGLFVEPALIDCRCRALFVQGQEF